MPPPSSKDQSGSNEWHNGNGHRVSSLVNSSSSPGSLGSILATAAAPFRLNSNNLGGGYHSESFGSLQDPYPTNGSYHQGANDYHGMSSGNDFVNQRRPPKGGQGGSYGQGTGPNARNSNSSNEDQNEPHNNHRVSVTFVVFWFVNLILTFFLKS